MFIHQSQLAFRPLIHGNLDRVCQSHIKGVSLIRLIQKHKDIKSL